MTSYLIDEINRLGLELTTPVDPNRRAGIVVSSRGRGIRVSPHFYNTIEELDSLVSVLRTT